MKQVQRLKREYKERDKARIAKNEQLLLKHRARRQEKLQEKQQQRELERERELQKEREREQQRHAPAPSPPSPRLPLESPLRGAAPPPLESPSTGAASIPIASDLPWGIRGNGEDSGGEL